MTKNVLNRLLKYDPIDPLLHCGHPAIETFTARDLVGLSPPKLDILKSKEVSKIVSGQRDDGSWGYPNPNLTLRSRDNFNQLETYRRLAILVEEFGLDRNFSVIRKAANYLLSFQTKLGDFRGIYGNQVSPNYSAAISESLIKAGYRDDSRVIKCLHWLLSSHQNDGGWAIPFRTRNYNVKVIYSRGKTLEPDLTMPFSAMVTGVVLRAFAAHGGYKRNRDVMTAARLLSSALFMKDNYPDRSGEESWLRFNFPFWYTDLISALDTLSLLGFSPNEPPIRKGLQWLARRQRPNGSWHLKILKGPNKHILQLYLSLAICRIFKRFDKARD